MPLTIVATPGAANANSFVTLNEALAIVEAHTPVPEWEDADSQDALLVMATRVLSAYFSGRKILVADKGYYIVFPKWTGLVASTTQALPWPRIGMYDLNGNEILSTVIPEPLKWATVELALALAKEDTTLDNDAAARGITSVRAGSVAVTFKDSGILMSKPLPEAVLLYLVPSWYTLESIEYLASVDFEVMP